MKIKRLLFLILALVLVFSSCGMNENTDKPAEKTLEPGESRPSQSVRVISYNLDSNEASIAKRAEGLTSIILSLKPDSFGVQEARGSWVSYLNKYCSEKYGRVGVDAGGNEEATYGYFATYIFYRLDKYRVVDSGTFWMSKTPDVPSKYSDTVDCNRTCTWAILEDIYTGFRYVHMNCHLDWMDMKVNEVQIKMIAEQITYFERLGYPVFATGDYNAEEGCNSYKIITSYENIADPKYIAEKTMSLGTYPDYDTYDVNVEKPIDYCFVTKNYMEKVLEYRVVNEKYKGKNASGHQGEYVSDHFGVMVDATVKSLEVIDSSLSIPSFNESKIEASFDGKNINISFEPAKDSLGKVAKRYLIEISPEGGSGTYEKKLWGKMYSNEPQKLFSYKYTPKSSCFYTIKITPYDLFENVGTPAEIRVDANKAGETDNGEVPSADLFDLGFTGTEVVDNSKTGMKITKYGKPQITENSISFNKKSNLNMKQFDQYIGEMEDGFTQEIIFSASDVKSEQGLFSCMHAGGFGFYIDGGNLLFYLRIGSAYETLKYAIEVDQKYHAVAVYDGSIVTLYVDGQEVDSENTEGSFGYPTDAKATFLCLGADSDASGNGESRSSATVYCARLYSDPLSFSKITKLF